MSKNLDSERNEMSGAVIAAAIEVHQTLGGPGLLEDVYEAALAAEFDFRGIPFEQQVRKPVIYKGRTLNKQYVLDLLVFNRIVVECKATIEDHPVYRAQCLTQLRLTGLRLGLVINFGQRTVRDGLHRVINSQPPSS